MKIKMTKTIIRDKRKYIGINKNIITYTARHSFSTALKSSGVSIEFISESFGHSDLKTTEKCLDSFENDIKTEFVTKLTALKKS
ncbi:MAG: tyrosine-type recombinase/integrase [Bacteroidales bacterium]|nr:tyrosine-type recombinase/integrase [Bacteroidales bacterium]